MTMPAPAPVDPNEWRTLGGSVQAVLARWTRDDGAVYVTDLMTEAEVGDGQVEMRLCKPVPEFDVFALGASKVCDADGTLGAVIPPQPSGRTFSVELWSANIHDGRVIGFWLWSVPSCTAVRFGGTQLHGKDVTMMAYRATTLGSVSYRLVPELPRWVDGLNLGGDV